MNCKIKPQEHQTGGADRTWQVVPKGSSSRKEGFKVGRM